MRRAVARGRMLPQSLSTDPRYGRLSLKAQVLYPLMWINADDQGRLSGDPDEIKYAACPSVREITADDIPTLLQEMETRGMLKVYTTSKTKATQMLDWWDVQKLQWAYPSEYPPPEGWQDKLRYHATPKEIVMVNWVLPSELGSTLPSALQSSPLTTPSENEKKEEGGRGRGNLPSALGSNQTSPSPTGDFIKNSSEIFSELTNCFRYRWGRVPPHDPYTVIPREPDPRESAQLRDFAEEISAAGGLPRGFIKKAFDEAVEHEKKHISYVRAMLLDWLGIERGPPGEKRRPGRRKRAGVPLNE